MSVPADSEAPVGTPPMTIDSDSEPSVSASDEEIEEGVLRMAASNIAAERSAELAEAGADLAVRGAVEMAAAGAAADLAGEMAAEGVADVATGAAEIGAAMAEEAVAEEMGEGED